MGIPIPGGLLHNSQVRFPVYKPVGYTCNSSLINVSWGAHAAGASQFSAMRCGDMALPKRLWGWLVVKDEGFLSVTMTVSQKQS